jgi:hypothetical protein
MWGTWFAQVLVRLEPGHAYFYEWTKAKRQFRKTVLDLVARKNPAAASGLVAAFSDTVSS